MSRSDVSGWIVMLVHILSNFQLHFTFEHTPTSPRCNIVLKNATETRTASPAVYRLHDAQIDPGVNTDIDDGTVIFTRYLDIVMIPGTSIKKVELK